MCLLLAIALSSFLLAADPKGDLSILSVKVFPATAERRSNRNHDMAVVQFNISTDLSPLFNWNTKQLFIYLAAEYNNTQGVKNEVVIWDRIVRRKEDAAVSVVGRNKYLLRESSSFKGVTPAYYTLKYNVMPYVGFLTYGETGRTLQSVPFPKAQRQV